MTKLYSIRGVIFRQSETLFGEDQKLRAIIGGRFADLNNMNVIALVEKLYFDGVLQEVFRIVLKPVRTLSAWNVVVARLRGVDIADPFPSMSKKMITRVAIDFFILSASWLKELTKRKGARDIWEILTMTEAKPSNSNTIKSSTFSQMATSQSPAKS